MTRYLIEIEAHGTSVFRLNVFMLTNPILSEETTPEGVLRLELGAGDKVQIIGDNMQGQLDWNPNGWPEDDAGMDPHTYAWLYLEERYNNIRFASKSQVWTNSPTRDFYGIQFIGDKK
jgi:hypothetical protein